MELHWIRERAIAPRSEQEAIYAEVIEKTPDVFVAVFDDAILDIDASHASGRKRFRNVTMVAVRNAGENDFTSTELTPEHEARYPNAVGIYRAKRDTWARQIALELLPGITPADAAELRALKVPDVLALAEAQNLPAELQQWQVMARRFQTLNQKPRLRVIDGAVQEVA